MATAILSRPTTRTSGFDARTFGNAFIKADRALHEGHALTADQRLTIIQSLAHVGLRDLLITHLDAYGPELWESLGDQAMQLHKRSAAEAYTLAFISAIIHDSADSDRILDKARCHNHYTPTSLLGLVETALACGNEDNAVTALRRGVAIAREDFVSAVPLAFNRIVEQLDRA